MSLHFKYQPPTEEKVVKHLSLKDILRIKGKHYRWQNKRLESFNYTDISQMLVHNCELYSNRIAFQKYDELGRLNQLTYHQWLINARNVASQLQKLGIQPGDHIALLLDNGLEWVTAILAIFLVGAIAVPLSVLLKPEELEFILDQSDSKYIISQVSYVERLVKANASLDLIVYPVQNSIRHIPPEYSSKFKSIALIDPNHGFALQPVDLSNPERLALIMYTSGTTTESKGVMLTHRAILYDIKVSLQALPFEILPIVTSLSFLPLTHILEFTAGFCCLNCMGSLNHFVHGYASKIIKQLINEIRPTIIIGVPLIFRHLMKNIINAIDNLPMPLRWIFGAPAHNRISAIGRNLIRNQLGGRLTVIITGGAAIELEVLEFYNSLNIYPLQGYGLTETSPVVTLCPITDNRLGSVGVLLEGIEIKIDNPDDMGVGEILIKGPMLFNGYYKNDEATKAAFTEDGWFRSGDLGTVDVDGYLYFKGRLKNLIVTPGGKNVYPEEVEEKLNSSPLFKEAAAFGYPFREQGEMELAAIIVPNLEAIAEHLQMPKGAVPSNEQVLYVVQQEMDRLLAKLANYKHPKMWRIYNGELPRTSTKKTIARKCVILFTQLINRPY